MITSTCSRMRRHTRPAGYVSKSRQAEAMGWGRPGGRTFSFTGEFPETADQKPVEAPCRRRNYTASHHTGSYQAVRPDEPHRMPAINKYGVHFMTALALVFAAVLVLGSFFVAKLDERDKVLESIAGREKQIEELTLACSETSNEIKAQSNDVNIRTLAKRMGMVSAKGKAVQYLETPKDAVITLKNQTAIQSIASIWGN